jgi:DNA-binding NtrC family response regulator
VSELESIAALVDASPSLAARLRGAERAARSDSPILILGEPGTGRSILARAFHRASPRRHGPLVELDPGVVPSTLFEGELFGFEAGAFTGAERPSEGRAARAGGGTLVLDHLEELPLAIQPKLLRLVAEKLFAPLGGSERRADVRFIAIGGDDLPERVERRVFRSDLYYRLEVLAFRLPPLRDRRADLPSICDALLAELSRRFSRPVPRLGERSRKWMADYGWPGNLRQVRNVLERALIVTGGDEIDPPPPRDAGAERPVKLVDLEREHIRRTLAYTRGHQGRAAELLGISRKALWEKRKRYGIP